MNLWITAIDTRLYKLCVENDDPGPRASSHSALILSFSPQSLHPRCVAPERGPANFLSGHCDHIQIKDCQLWPVENAGNAFVDEVSASTGVYLVGIVRPGQFFNFPFCHPALGYALLGVEARLFRISKTPRKTPLSPGA